MAKGNLQLGLEYAESAVKNHSIYVWGGQGEMLSATSDQKIRNMETSATNANRAIAMKNKVIAAGYGDVAQIYDCSGLVCRFLVCAGSVLQGYDDTANGLLNQCTPISRAQLTVGCFVGRKSNTNTYHIGIVVAIENGQVIVIESMGRDQGCVRRTLDASGASYWNRYGRPDKWFDFGFTPQPVPDPKPAPAWELTRLLKVLTPYMKGNDVTNLQRALTNQGYSVGSTGADGVYGGGTKNAVVQFQKANGLTADGVVGEKTCRALGGRWNPVAVPAFTLSRLLKVKSPLMKGADVAAVQKALIARGCSVGNAVADGAYGNATKAAVISFQKAVGLSADGIVGKDTCRALNGQWE